MIDIFLLAGLVLLVLLTAGVAVVYHSLTQARLRCHDAWSELVGVLKGRLALVPHLVDLANNYAPSDQVKDQLLSTCQQASQARGLDARAQAEIQLVVALEALIRHAQRYPGLQSHTEFARLREELTSAENRIRMAAETYNHRAREYNAKRGRRGWHLLARLLNLRPVSCLPDQAIGGQRD